MKLTWGAAVDRRFETGVSNGVLYLPDEDGDYTVGVPWNGLTTVTESPSGAEANKQYADNGVYLNILSAEEFAATIEAFSYPSEFEKCDGSYEVAPGVYLGQQGRTPFGFSYRTIVGNALNPELGYKLHLVWGCLASPSEKAHATVNESPEPTGMSWEVSTTPATVGEVNGVEHKATATLTIDSTKCDADALAALEDILYGDESDDASLPAPADVLALFVAESLTEVDLGTPASQPTYNSGTHVVTLPAVTGVVWKINGVTKAAGAQPALTVGQTANVKATPAAGYVLEGDDDWSFNY